jgi:serine/threonine-protein kinase
MTAQPIPFEATPVSAQIPQAMRAGILRSLAKNREERQSTAKQFYDELAGDASAPAPQPASGSTGTAQMPAPPAFGAAQAMGNAKTAAMPSTGSAVAVPAAQPAPAFAPPKSGGKGLVFTLAGVGGVLLIGIVIVAARSMKPKGADAPAAPIDVAPAPVTTVAAQPPEPAEPAAPTAAPAAPTAPPEHPAGTPSKTGTGTTGTGTAAKPPPSKDPCAACIAAASGGNIAGAGASLGACTDAAQKSHCAQLIRSGAPSAAQEAAFNGRCPQAKAIAAAGQSAGVSAHVFANALKACK